MVTKYIVVSKRAGRISCAESQTVCESSEEKDFLNVVQEETVVLVRKAKMKSARNTMHFHRFFLLRCCSQRAATYASFSALLTFLSLFDVIFLESFSYVPSFYDVCQLKTQYRPYLGIANYVNNSTMPAMSLDLHSLLKYPCFRTFDFEYNEILLNTIEYF